MYRNIEDFRNQKLQENTTDNSNNSVNTFPSNVGNNSNGDNLPVFIENKLNAEEIDPEILENIRCSKCSSYFFPPIYLCPKGHNLCNHCKQNMHFDATNVFGKADTNSSGASGAFNFNSLSSGGIINPAPSTGFSSPSFAPCSASTRNSVKHATLPDGNNKTILSENYFCGKCNAFFPSNKARRTTAREKSLKVLNFPCGNANNNCSYRNKLSQVKDHEQTCLYAIRSCFFQNCEWKGTTVSMITHFEEKHTCIGLNQKTLLTEGKNINVMFFDDKFFLLKTMYTPCGSLQFSVLYPGESNKYKFELYLMGHNKDIKIILSNYCEPLLNENVLKTDQSSEEISVPFDCLKHFMTNLEKLWFQINIVKID